MTINTRLEKLEKGKPKSKVEILLYWHGEDNQTIDGQLIPKAPGGIQLQWRDELPKEINDD